MKQSNFNHTLQYLFLMYWKGFLNKLMKTLKEMLKRKFEKCLITFLPVRLITLKNMYVFTVTYFLFLCFSFPLSCI